MNTYETKAVYLPETGSLEGKLDPEDMNDRRANAAECAVEGFRLTMPTDDEDALCDLLCDLMHWCDRNGESFRLEMQRAVMHYEAETTTG